MYLVTQLRVLSSYRNMYVQLYVTAGHRKRIVHTGRRFAAKMGETAGWILPREDLGHGRR